MSDLRGTAKVWFPDRGYGFIAGDDGQDYFVHWTEIVMQPRRKKLEPGQRVTFDVEQTDKGCGWKAVGVVPDRMEEGNGTENQQEL